MFNCRKGNNFQRILTHGGPKQDIAGTYGLVYRGYGTIRIAPIVIRSNTATSAEKKRREESAKYLLENLINCKQLRASRVGQLTSLSQHLANAVKSAVVRPMTALQGCSIDAIFDDEHWRATGQDLIKKAWMVIRNDLPGGVSFEQVRNGLPVK